MKDKDNSIAQAIANEWNVTVKASMRRTNYGGTWETGFSGYYDEYISGNRKLIDGKVWEEDGADAPMKSGSNQSQLDLLPEGYFNYEPK